MPSAFRFVAPVLALACAACTAVKVVTHTTDHFGYSRFVMRFDHMEADLDFHPEDPTHSSVKARIAATSLDTNVADLDEMVRSSDLLDAEHFPEITFVSKTLRATGKNTGEMDGELTIHGQTKPVTLTVTFNGGAPNPLTDKHTLGFSATGHFNRSAFGLGRWYPAVGREIQLRIEAEFESEKS
jgi:polyisoprenoid-binding protein YceI